MSSDPFSSHRAKGARLRIALGLCAAAAVAAANGLVVFSCGGTTGREGLTTASGDDGGLDADLGPDLDADTFDVVISYADRPLPDVVARPEAGIGDGGGYPWPTCPPFIPVDSTGEPVPPGGEVDQVPAVLDDAGDAAAAPDGSACATYGWLGSTAVDECVTSQGSGIGMGADYILLPPCNWAANAGVAVQGPGAGESRFALCEALYACMMQTGCGRFGDARCLCGTDTAASDCVKSPAGPCLNEELAALEQPPESIAVALKNYDNIVSSVLGYSGGMLNQLFTTGATNQCFAGDGGSTP
ncbi:MAG TPA: hypothetical protein VGI39_16040 [Polyangiaceae bacterium]|jgi:hypothetical protein